MSSALNVKEPVPEAVTAALTLISFPALNTKLTFAAPVDVAISKALLTVISFVACNSIVVPAPTAAKLPVPAATSKTEFRPASSPNASVGSPGGLNPVTLDAAVVDISMFNGSSKSVPPMPLVAPKSTLFA